MNPTADTSLDSLYADHPRRWRSFDYVYPVLSRRAKGMSVGVNLNPDKVCNWDCVYCQVERDVPAARRDVDLDQVCEELDWMLGCVASGAIWRAEPFENVPEAMRRVNDIAFSGDGEPTTYPRFDEAVERAAALKRKHKLSDAKVVVLSNMTMCHRPAVQRGFELLDANQGEIWAKLEAGTQAYYDRVDRSAVKLERVLANITETARRRPIVIQSLFMKLHGEPTPRDEFEAYLDRVGEVIGAGGRIKLVQLYTIARQTTEAYAAPLSDAQLDGLATRFRERLPDVPCEVYYGVGE